MKYIAIEANCDMETSDYDTFWDKALPYELFFGTNGSEENPDDVYIG